MKASASCAMPINKLEIVFNGKVIAEKLSHGDEGEKVLREALAVDPAAGDIHFALGLLLVRRGQSAEALHHLGRAAELNPRNVRFHYVLGVALHSSGEFKEMEEIAAAVDAMSAEAAARLERAEAFRHAPEPVDTGALAAQLDALMGKA